MMHLWVWKLEGERVCESQKLTPSLCCGTHFLKVDLLPPPQWSAMFAIAMYLDR